ncbi:MAG: undecaprenyldiphospho-muramoylpentapeptide beta-N-acetylglucosaminyltransferase [Candidatus Aminicenantales bacterium]
MKEKRVIISGGGTGGHVYPALVLGQKLKEKAPDLQLTFVGSRREAEKKIMEHYGVRFIPMKIEGLRGKGWKSGKSLPLLPSSFIKSLAILARTKPHLAVGVGGFSSGPIVLLASAMKIPTLILEQNLKPGFTNRMLLPWAKKAVVAFQNSLPYFRGKGVFIGNPVREEFYALAPKARTSRLTLLIFGGSQGSHFLNQAVVHTLPFLQKEKDHLHIFHQTGPKDLEEVKNGYKQNGFTEAVIAPYFHNMSHYFQQSDLIICRAGATTCAELIASQKASILIPFARAADNHQALNARELEKVKGAEVLLEAEFSPQILVEKILSLMRNKDRITQMEKNLGALKTEKVADQIASLCLTLMRSDNEEE